MIKTEKCIAMASRVFERPKHFESDASFRKWERCQNKMQKLLYSKRHAQIRRVQDGRAFSVFIDGKNILYTGLRPRLKSVLWPLTEEDPKRQTPEEVKARKSTEFKSIKSTYKAKDCKLYGAKHGSLVHKQMEQYFSCFVSGNQEDALKDPDPCTVRLISSIADNGWIPVASELEIWDKEWRVATSIDMVVYDPKEFELVLLEFKTGKENQEYGPHPSDKKLPYPFQEITNCPLVRDEFQLFSMNRILARCYGVTVDESFILRARPKAGGTDKIGLFEWCTKKKYKDFLDTTMLDKKSAGR